MGERQKITEVIKTLQLDEGLDLLSQGIEYLLVQVNDVRRGPQGPQGLTGAQGEPGISDIPGPKGERGEKGEPGEKGVSNVPGPQGPQGERGQPGHNGKDGAPGPQGLRGLQGDRGEKGDRGVQGIQGERGPQGAVGEKGAQGDRGQEGPAGKDSVSVEEVRALILQIIGSSADEYVKRYIAARKELEAISTDTRFHRVHFVREEIVKRLAQHLNLPPKD